jgi:hypothetical protein
MSRVIIGNSVYRRVEALQEPKPDQNAMLELATLLGFKVSDRISPPTVMKRLQGVVNQILLQFKASMANIAKVQKVLRKELAQKPAQAAMILEENYVGDNAIRNLSNYENPGMMEDWAEFPAKLGMSYVDMSNELPPALRGQGEVFDEAAELIELFDEIVAVVTEVDERTGDKLERVGDQMQDAVKAAFFG